MAPKAPDPLSQSWVVKLGSGVAEGVVTSTFDQSHSSVSKSQKPVLWQAPEVTRMSSTEMLPPTPEGERFVPSCGGKKGDERRWVGREVGS